MTTEDFEFSLSQYLDGALPAAQRVALEERLSADPSARELLEEYRCVDAAVRSSAPALPAVRWDRLAEHLSEAVAEVAEPTRSYSIAWVRGLVGLAVAASVMLFVGMLAHRGHQQPHPSPLVEAPKIQPAPAVIVQVTGPQAEPAAGPPLVEVSIGRPAGAGSVYTYGDSVVVQRPRVTFAGVTPSGERASDRVPE